MDSTSAKILALCLFIIMLGMGLGLVTNDFKRIFIYPKAVLIGLCNQIIIVPLIGFLLASIFPVQPEIAVGIMILASCPGGATSNLICNLAKGDIALSVTLTAISSFITILTIPFIINFSLQHFLNQGQIIQLDVWETIKQVLAITVIPVGLGMLIRRYKEDLASKMEKPVRIASGVIMAVVVIGVVIKEKDSFVSGFQQAGAVALSLNIATMAIGYFSAKLFKVNLKRAISIAIESGVQNGTLAITIASVLLYNNKFAIAPAAYSLLMFLTGGIVIYLSIRSSKKE